MSKELVIGSNRHETKVAVLEDDQLTEIYFQRANEYSLAGSIHKGRVTRVLPGMQSAFVDLGLERDTFLYVSDFFEEHEDIDTVSDDKPTRPERVESRAEVRVESRVDSRVDSKDRRDTPDGRERRESPERFDNKERRDRGPLRSTERPPAILQDAVEPLPAIVPLAELPIPSATSFPAMDEPPRTFTPRPSGEQPERKGGERPEGDRGIRGDRRGGRSRRRRTRGTGIPENKYAHPGSASPFAPTSEPSPGAQPQHHRPEQQEEQEGARDVIVLPGESLAKYRRVVTVTGVDPSAPIWTASMAEPELDPEADEVSEIEAEAEELELVEKIFSHHDDESVLDVEEKIEEVRQDQAPSTFTADDIEPEERITKHEEEPLESRSAEFRSPSGIEHLRTSFEYHDEPQITLRSEPTEFASFPGEIPEEERLSAAEHAEDEVAEAASFGAGDLEGDEVDVEDAGISSELSDAEPGDFKPNGAPASASNGGAQDQNERPLQRNSRRMRRRRGGSRFSQQSSESGPTEIVGISTGAAIASITQPEVRIEPRREMGEERPNERPERVLPSISELLKAGQEIIVQIAKEPLGQKGARITSHIALPGRYVVFMPSVAHLGVSRKIASDEERQRLKRVLQAHRAGTTGGFIVRTAGEGIPEDEIAADMDFLYKLWLDIRQKAEKKPAPMLLHYDLDIVQRILRDQVTEDFKAIWVDNEEMYEHVLSFTQRFQPALVNRVKMYTRSAPIFDAFGITQELEKALRPKVWLKSGGYIVINQTEALVAIDINTGKYVGKSNRLEDTIVKTNIEAVKEIVRQIRLRDLGGIIVVDFIDMDERKNRQKVMQVLEEAMEADKAPYKILQFNDFGLVAITRKRVKQSLERTLCAPCPYCEGAGYVKSVQTIIGEILIEAQKIARAIEGKDVMLRVHPDVAKILKANDNKYLEELEEILGRPVLVKGDPALHHEKFDLG